MRPDPKHRSFEFSSVLTSRKGLLICLLSGVLSACFNIGFALTADISKAAERLGASPTDSTFAIWALILGAGFLPSAGYTLYLLNKNRSFKLFRTKHINWSYAFSNGCFVGCRRQTLRHWSCSYWRKRRDDRLADRHGGYHHQCEPVSGFSLRSGGDSPERRWPFYTPDSPFCWPRSYSRAPRAHSRQSLWASGKDV